MLWNQNASPECLLGVRGIHLTWICAIPGYRQLWFIQTLMKLLPQTFPELTQRVHVFAWMDLCYLQRTSWKFTPYMVLVGRKSRQLLGNAFWSTFEEAIADFCLAQVSPHAQWGSKPLSLKAAVAKPEWKCPILTQSRGVFSVLSIKTGSKKALCVLHRQETSEIFIWCTGCELLAFPWAKCHSQENKCSASPLHFRAQCVYNNYFYSGFYFKCP